MCMQDGKVLPDGPVVISPDGLFPSLYREGYWSTYPSASPNFYAKITSHLLEDFFF